MNPNERIVMHHEDEIDFFSILQSMWSYKYLIACAVIVCGSVAVFFALTATPSYRAEAVIIQVSDSGMAGASALANQFGGLASLAGLNFSAGNGTARQAQAVLKSRYLAEEFIKRNKLMLALSTDVKKPPTLWLAVKQFREGILFIREDKLKGAMTVTIDWKDPVIAAHWANGFVALANDLLRVRALNESKRKIAFLNEQISHTDVVELQRVLYNLVENETKTLMLANARVEYAFEVVDPAIPPEIRTSPRRTIIVLMGIVLGFLAGSFVAFLHSQIRRRRDVAHSLT